MTDYVHRKFPNRAAFIQALRNKGTAFREICDDYEEMCTWLDDYCRSQARPSEECDHARELIRDLEDEIIKVLRDAGYRF